MRTRMIKGLQKIKQTVTMTSSPIQSSEGRESVDGSHASSENLGSAKKRPEVSAAARAVGGGPMYEVLSIDATQAADHHSEPMPYRFCMPEGFKQLNDPQTNLGTNTFVCGQDSSEYLQLRGRMTVLDTTMSKIRQQMEWFLS